MPECAEGAALWLPLVEPRVHLALMESDLPPDHSRLGSPWPCPPPWVGLLAGAIAREQRRLQGGLAWAVPVRPFSVAFLSALLLPLPAAGSGVFWLTFCCVSLSEWTHLRKLIQMSWRKVGRTARGVCASLKGQEPVLGLSRVQRHNLLAQPGSVVFNGSHGPLLGPSAQRSSQHKTPLSLRGCRTTAWYAQLGLRLNSPPWQRRVPGWIRRRSVLKPWELWLLVGLDRAGLEG